MTPTPPAFLPALARLFADGHNLVFWNDADGEFTQDVDSLALDNVTVLRLDEIPLLKVKRELEAAPAANWLLYSPAPVPEPVADWLLDARLRGKAFSADTASIQLDELGLASHALRQGPADRLAQMQGLAQAMPEHMAAWASALEWAPANAQTAVAIEQLPGPWRLRVSAARADEFPELHERCLSWLDGQSNPEIVIHGLMFLRQRGVTLWLNTPMVSLTQDGARVSGVVVRRDGQDITVRARRAVVLGAGGFERNQAMREQYLPQPTDQAWTATPPDANTGDAIRAGAAVGGALHLMAHTWGAPTIFVPKEEKHRAMFVERSMPGCMVVNARGERFLNESGPYPEFQQAMYANHEKTGGAVPAWIVFDANFRANYPIGPLMPAMAVPDSKLRKSWLGTVYWKGETLQELAQQIGVDPQGLQASAQRMSEFARTGKDLDFGRGDNVFDRYYGDVNVRPNPNLAPIEKGPFYAMKLHPGDIGTKGGLVTDRDARVLREDGQPVEGLYCVGNNSASVMGPSYPGAGSTLGPAMTFAYRAIAHIMGRPMALQRTDLLESKA